MEIKLVKSYRHDYNHEFGGNDPKWYYDDFSAEVKVIKDNPDFHPWERLFRCNLHIRYDGHSFANGHHWSLSGWSDRMDEAMTKIFGDTFVTFSSRKSLVDGLKKLVPFFPPVFYKDGKEIIYEFAEN